ncbi:MAG: hypothetical protein QM747_21550 [Nocardioides sp.]
MTHTTPTRATRRSVVRTGAWAVPVVATAVASPAYAVTSGCTRRGEGALVADDDGVVTSLTFPGGVSAVVEYAKHNGPTVLDPFDGETGHEFETDYGTPWSYLRLHHPEGMEQGDTLTLTITFSEPVTNLAFTVTDIDQYRGQWDDRVSLAPESFAVTAKGRRVTGSGTSADPFRSNQKGNIDSASGDVSVVWPGTIQVLTLTYVAADEDNTSDIGQMIGIGRFGYDSCAS